jgi:hypothetical protein
MLTSFEIVFLQWTVVVLLLLLGMSRSFTELIIRGCIFAVLMVFLLSIFLYN